jgi:hypothetical protein
MGGDSQLQKVPPEDVHTAAQGRDFHGNCHKLGQATETLHD